MSKTNLAAKQEELTEEQASTLELSEAAKQVLTAAAETTGEASNVVAFVPPVDDDKGNLEMPKINVTPQPGASEMLYEAFAQMGTAMAQGVGDAVKGIAKGCGWLTRQGISLIGATLVSSIHLMGWAHGYAEEIYQTAHKRGKRAGNKLIIAVSKQR